MMKIHEFAEVRVTNYIYLYQLFCAFILFFLTSYRRCRLHLDWIKSLKLTLSAQLTHCVSNYKDREMDNNE